MATPHPAKLLKKKLEQKRMTNTELADRANVSKQMIGLILSEERGISLKMAVAFSDVFGGKPNSWLHAQADYDLDKYMENASGR